MWKLVALRMDNDAKRELLERNFPVDIHACDGLSTFRRPSSVNGN